MTSDPTVHKRGVASLPVRGPDRITPAWRAWLEALATDAEAALGAALAYEELDANGRTAFLDALEQDAESLSVPRIALFAPFLSVEDDDVRRKRIALAMGEGLAAMQKRKPIALLGVAPDGDHVVVVVAPVYLDFVRVVSCRIAHGQGFRWVRSEPLMHAKDAPQGGSRHDGVTMEPTPMHLVVDEVAAAVVAQRAPDGSLPAFLQPLVELFDQRLRDLYDGDPAAR